MKSKIHFNILAALLLLPSVILATNTPSLIKKSTKEKTIQKSFNVNPNATLKVDNSYGNIDIITSESNTVEFDIVIRVTGTDEEKVEDRLNGIDVDFSATNTMVSAKTIIPKNKKSWWNWGGKKYSKLEINYVVKIPATNTINISNDYGNINVDKLEGRAELYCDYGKVTTKELMAENNILSFDYSKGCYFEYINSGKIIADYSSYTIGKTKSLAVNADYTKSNIEVAEDVVYNCDYGSLTVDNVNNIKGNGDYLTLRLGNVYKNVSLKADYGSIKIDRMASNAGNIDIESDYVGVTIGYDPAYNFNFNIDLEHASLRNSDGFDFTKKRIESSEKLYIGSYGSNANSMVNIKSEYGSVTFKKQ